MAIAQSSNQQEMGSIARVEGGEKVPLRVDTDSPLAPAPPVQKTEFSADR